MNDQPTRRTFPYGLEAVLPLLAAAGIEDTSHVESAELLFETNAVATLTVVEKEGTEETRRVFSFHDAKNEGICFGVLPAKLLLAQLGITLTQPLQQVRLEFRPNHFPTLVIQTGIDNRLALDWESLGTPALRGVTTTEGMGWR